jgi:uncharacterized damage-inducible protein DinB
MRLVLGLLLGLATSLSVVAQGSDPVSADLARDWAEQKARMVALAEAMPAEKYDFKATPPQRSFGEQLEHLAVAHVRMLKALDPDGRISAPAAPAGHSRDAVVKALSEAYDYGQKVIESSPMTERAGERSRARVVWAAMNNAMNHYGQCVVYLRLNDIVPPASRK